MRKPKEIKWKAVKGKAYELEVPYSDPENDVKTVGGYTRIFPATQDIRLKLIGNKLRINFVYADRAFFNDEYELDISSETISFNGVKFKGGEKGIEFESVPKPRKKLTSIKELTIAPGLPEKELGLVKKLVEILEKQTST
jgi:hypothetical protein